MCYSEIRETMPEITAGRNADKYHYAYRTAKATPWLP